MKTQSKKLAAVLRFGTMSMVTWQEIINEAKNPESEFYDSLSVRLDEINKYMKNNCFCWEFTPYEEYEDLERTRQYSNDPFTLVDYIFEIL